MVIWHSPELEQLLGVPLDPQQLTHEVIADLIPRQVKEGELLDFKRFETFPPKAGRGGSWSQEQEFAKDVAAFANHQGGVLILGVGEKDEIADSLHPEMTATPHDVEQRLRRALLNNAAPTIAAHWVTVEDQIGTGFFMVVVVPPSPSAPHSVKADDGGRRAFVYPVRDGAAVRWMAEAEVAVRYSGRDLNAQKLTTRLASVVDDGLASLEDVKGVWVYVALAPASEAPVVLTRELVPEVGQWIYRNEDEGPLGSSIGVLPMSLAGPGRVVMTASDQDNSRQPGVPNSGYAELYVAGPAFLAHPAMPDFDTKATQVGERTLIDRLISLVGTALVWTARQVGSSGPAILQVGLTAPGLEESEDAVELVMNGMSGNLVRMRSTRRLRRTPFAVVPVDLGAAATTQDRLAVTYQAVAALTQHFGLADLPHLRPDGSVDTREWNDREREVARWAHDRDVPHETTLGLTY